MKEIKNNNDDYNIYGYISLPEVTRANKNNMTTIVNGRVVKNSTLYRTINEAYSNFKEDSRYPICVLIIDTDPRLLDVNIHPSKLDIKFSNFTELNNLIKDTINNALKDKMLIPSIKSKEIKEIKKYENLVIDIDRNNIIKENEENYKKKLDNLINFNIEDVNNIDDILLEQEKNEEITEVKTIDDDSKKLPEPDFSEENKDILNRLYNL